MFVKEHFSRVFNRPRSCDEQSHEILQIYNFGIVANISHRENKYHWVISYLTSSAKWSTLNVSNDALAFFDKKFS